MATIRGTAASDVLNGGNASDRITGLAGDDTLNGGRGNDTLDGGVGNDLMVGGAGNDTYLVNSSLDRITETATGGTDTVLASITYTLNTTALRYVENLTLTGTAANGTGNTAHNRITGNTRNNKLVGQNGNDTLVGGGGNDTLDGGAGNDSLDGGAGSDRLVGGAGNDSYVVDATGDQVVEPVNNGDDSVTSTITYILASSLENLTLAGIENIDGTGTPGPNLIIGNAGNNLLSGMLGDDTLVGGAGDDTLDSGSDAYVDSLVGGAGNDLYIADAYGDVMVESADGGIDTLHSEFVVSGLAPNVEHLVLLGTANLFGYANEGDNSITGTVGNNYLFGLAGNDTLDAGEGNDELEGGAGNDLLRGGIGNDIYYVDSAGDTILESDSATDVDRVQSSVSFTLDPFLEILALTGTDNINGTGSTGNDSITGNSGNNMLFGMQGNDTLDGGMGDDVLDGGEGADVLSEFYGNNTLVGGAGADSVQGGNGDDRIVWDADDVAIDGSGGTNTLMLTGNAALDLTQIDSSVIRSFKIIELAGTNTLTLNITDVLLLPEGGPLRVDGGAGDAVQRGAGWTLGADQVIGEQTYRTYTQAAAMLLVDSDISVGI
jgi:Ca2+-binding RTX toxin-like protein